MQPINKVISSFLFAKEIQGLSPNTIRNYRLTLSRFVGYFGDEIPYLKDISPHDIRAFLHTLKTTAPDNRSIIPREPKPLSPKSIRNAHGTLSSLWEWAIEEGLAKENIVRAVKPPNPKLPTIQPFEADEIRKLLRQTGQGETAELRLRDRTLILFLLDTGVRVTELINLRIRDTDLRLGTALVQGKGRLDSGQGKQRMVYFGDRVKRSLQRYLSERGEPEPSDWLFVNKYGRQLERGALGRHIRRLGERVGVSPCNPHKFRHSFAIYYLRNGGDVFTLQRLLGHSSLDMVKRYLAIAQADVEAAHRKAGPVDHWGL